MSDVMATYRPMPPTHVLGTFAALAEAIDRAGMDIDDDVQGHSRVAYHARPPADAGPPDHVESTILFTLDVVDDPDDPLRRAYLREFARALAARNASAMVGMVKARLSADRKKFTRHLLYNVYILVPTDITPRPTLVLPYAGEE